MIIGETLKKLLINSNNIVANKLLELETATEDWKAGVGYANIAVENPSKISFVTEDRYKRIIESGPKQEYIDTSKPISLKKHIYDDVSLGWFGRISITRNLFYIRSVNRNFNNTIYEVIVDNGWFIKPSHIKWFKQKVKTIPNPDDIWIDDLRQRYAYMISPAKFANKFKIDCSQKELEDFNRLFLKNDICLRVEGVHFEEVTGEEIKYCYDGDNYYEEEDGGGGTLGGSCMRYKNCQEFLNFYAKYPQQINLLALKTKDNKIRGRAILWKFTHEDNNITFMDRIYVDNSNFEQFFINYAESNGWWHKATQSYSYKNTFYTPDDGYKAIISKNIYITLEDVGEIPMPYLDTFTYGRWKGSNIIFNNYDGDLNFTSTEGGPLIDAHNNQVYSEYSDCWIDEDESRYSNYLGQWLHEDDAVYIEYKNDYMPEDSDDICEIDGNYYFKEDCVYSDYHDRCLKTEDAIEIDGDWYKLEDCVYSEKLEEDILSFEAVHSKYYDSYIKEEDSIEINGDYILKEDLEEYKIEMGLEEEVEVF